MTSEEKLLQMQVGTLAAIIAICDALVDAKAIKHEALIARLRAACGDAASSRLGPAGRNTIEGLITAIERVANSRETSPGKPN
ncbi:MAG TPA: hypothetical protein VHN11_10250 [Xanthobacteraceae bacterium]|nr:hypothetical protein [Xanthobacteraceae bacterium]